MVIRGNAVGCPLPDARKGLAMQGAIYMNGQKLTGLDLPEEANDAATKAYADSLHRVLTVTLPASGWSDAAPYTQTLAADGILKTDTPHWSVVYADNADTALAEKEAFCMVDDLETADGSVTFTCFEEKPDRNLTIQLEVNR